MTIRDIAAIGYAVAGDDYERARPSYPAAAVALLVGELGIGADSTVLDLAAGTGKLTRLLRPTGARLIAVEPVREMRRHLGALPDVRVLDGTAEAIPLPDGAVDAVVVGTAFHWFRGDAALSEIVRVLKPGGGLGLIWNNPDVDVDWVAEIWDLAASKRRSAPRNRDLSWKAAFASAERPLGPLRHRRFSHRQQLGIDGLVARVHSISFVASLPADERDGLLERVREIARAHLRAGASTLELPYLTDVYWSWRR